MVWPTLGSRTAIRNRNRNRCHNSTNGRQSSTAARLILSGRRRDHITPLFVQLHWLRVPERTEYQLCVLYRCLHATVPEYLASSFQRVSDVTTRGHLRSAATSQLIVSVITRCSTLGYRAFSVAAARACNALPRSVSSTPPLRTFRRLLKADLFHRISFVILVHGQVTIIFVVSVCLSVCLCRVFLSRL